MPKSYVQYVGNGTTTDFTIHFPYISHEHVKVKVDGVETGSFAWINENTIRLTTPPAAGKVVEIRRITPTTPLTVFNNNSILRADDLNRIVKQATYLAEESEDRALAALPLVSTGIYDAGNRRIGSLAAPVSAADAANKAYVDAAIASVSGGAPPVIGVEQSPRYETVVVGSGEAIPVTALAEQLELVDGKVREVYRTVTVQGAGNVSVTLPDGSGLPGLGGGTFVIKNASTGSLTINAPSGSTVNGGSSVVIPWPNGTAVLVADAVSGTSVTWSATGDLNTGLSLPKTDIIGDLTVSGNTKLQGTVQGGRRLVRPKITANTVLSATDDVGTIRHVEGNNITVTVPAAFLGTVDLIFDTAGTIAFAGGPSYAISAGKRAVVDVHTDGTTTYRYVYDPAPRTS
jgi:hypothetical protein